MLRYSLILTLLAFFSWDLKAQGIFDKQLPKHIYEENVVDSVYGITMYENLVIALGGDSIRKNGVYPANGWIEDAYKSGQIIHKGFYQTGQLLSYKNYYPNGQLERDFSSLDAMFGECKIYYSTGQLKSLIKYSEGTPKQWTDYYANGKVQYEEKMNKSMEYYEYQRYFFDSGSMQKITELVDKKKLEFTYTEYYGNGQIKIQGKKIFLKESNSYFDHGDWNYFDESGSKIKTEKFDRGVKI